jgi:hypothetical protein
MSYEKVFSYSNNNNIMNSTDILLGSNDYSDNDVLKSNFANKSGPSFSFEQLPTAYFAENQSSKLLRKQLVKREIARTDMDTNDDNGGINILEKYFLTKVAACGSLLDKISLAIWRTNSSNNMPVFLYLEFFNLDMS